MPHDAIVMIDPDENRLLELPLSGRWVGQIFTKHLECIKRSNVNIWQLHTHAQFTCKYVLLSFFLLLQMANFAEL